MSKPHGTVPKIKQDRAFLEALIANAPVLSGADTQYWIRHQGELKRFLSGLSRGQETTSDIVREWERFYAKYFSELKVDLASVVIPKKEGLNRVIIVAKGLTLNRVYEVCASKFASSRSHDDLDAVGITSDRTPSNGSYAVTCWNLPEASGLLRSISARELDERGTKTMTLLERMLFELKYFDETGKHLDLENVTLCAGSRRAEGFIPIVDWKSEFRVDVGSCDFDARPWDLRAREVAVAPSV